MQRETICFNELGKVNDLLSRFLELYSHISNISFMFYHNGIETLDDISFYKMSTFSEVTTSEEIAWQNISIDPFIKEIKKINLDGYIRLDTIENKSGFSRMLFYANVKSAVIYPVETLDQNNEEAPVGLVILSYKEDPIKSNAEYNAKAIEITKDLAILLNKLKK